MQIAKLELRELLQREPVDLAAVDAKVRQIQNMKTDMFISFLKTKEQVKAVLSPEQRERLKNLERGGLAMTDDAPLFWEGDDEAEAEED